MKKFLIVILSLLLLSGCAKGKESDDDIRPTKPKEHFDVVFLADSDFIYDNGVNERCLYGIRDYCEENGLKYTFLQPADATEASMEEAFIEAAEQMSCAVLVAAGGDWDIFLAKRMEEYRQLKAIYIDGEGKYSAQKAPDHPDNLALISFAEEEAAYMAGYAVIQDGYRRLGWICENEETMAGPVASGFVRGICDALSEIKTEAPEEEQDKEKEEKQEETAQLLYACAESLEEDLATKAAKWYEEGTEIIFVLSDEISDTLIPVARESISGKLIGWRYDEYLRKALDGEDYEPLYVTSTVNDVELLVYNAVKAAYAGSGEWGRYAGKNIFKASAKENGVSLAPYRSINWRTLTKSDYDLLKQRASYALSIPASEDAFDTVFDGLTITPFE